LANEAAGPDDADDVECCLAGAGGAANGEKPAPPWKAEAEAGAAPNVPAARCPDDVRCALLLLLFVWPVDTNDCMQWPQTPSNWSNCARENCVACRVFVC
jgi:hypothetical protein